MVSVLWALALGANAQVTATLQAGKSQYVAGEPVMVALTLSNQSGQNLQFQNGKRFGWLEIVVKSQSGQVVGSRGRSQFSPVKIGIGKTITTQVNLSDAFLLNDPGMYSVSAIVRHNTSSPTGVLSNRAVLNLGKGHVFWSQSVGLIGKPSQTRQFNMIQFNGNNKPELYSQVINRRTGQSMNTQLLGNALMANQPSVALDQTQKMHVLFMINPTMWVHYIVGTEGQIVKRTLFQTAAGSGMQMISMPSGQIQIAGGSVYDPATERKKVNNRKKASDRPFGQ